MGISKSVLMKNGVTATFWKIVKADVDLQGLTTTFIVQPFLDADTAAARGKPVGPSKIYSFKITENQILTGSLNGAYTNILAKAASSVPNLDDGGTHIYDPDIAGGSIVS